ncbi:MAG: MFS transporter, partial [Ideonella sp.]
AWGFVSFAVLSLAMLLMLRVVQIRWTRTWAEKGGRARAASNLASATPEDRGTAGALHRMAKP